jgi:hypothetical protein
MQHMVNFAEYYQERSQRPRTFEQFVELVKASRQYRGQTKGIWELVQFDPKRYNPESGAGIITRVWNMNALTDNGANQLLQRGCNSSAATLPALFNNLLITNNSGSTTLTSALVSGTVYTSLAVAATPAAIPSGTSLQIGFGTGQTQTVVSSGSTAQAATSITVNSFTANANYASSGISVVPVAQTADNPSSGTLTNNASVPLTSYSGNLATGAFTFTQGAGAGNRTDLVQFTFNNATNGGSTANGAYTDSWIVNVSSGATTNNYLVHEINVLLSVNNSNSILAKATVGI